MPVALLTKTCIPRKAEEIESGLLLNFVITDRPSSRFAAKIVRCWSGGVLIIKPWAIWSSVVEEVQLSVRKTHMIQFNKRH